MTDSAQPRRGRWLPWLAVAAAVAAAGTTLWLLQAPPTLPAGERPAAGHSQLGGGRLTDLFVGLPGGKANLGEIRQAFTPREEVMMHGTWTPEGTPEGTPEASPLTVDFEWFGPDGARQWSSTLQVEAAWRNTWSTYRGPKPMAAGTWTVRVRQGDRVLGALGFDVVRDESAAPIRVQARAFAEERLDAVQAAALLRAAQKVLSAAADPAKVVEGLDPTLRGRRLQVALAAYREQRPLLQRLGDGDTLGGSLTDVLAALAGVSPPPTGADDTTYELTVLHSGIELGARPTQIGAYLAGDTGFSLRIGERTATLLPAMIRRMNLQEGVDVMRQLSLDATGNETAWDGAGTRLHTFKAQQYVLPPGAAAGDAGVLELLSSRTLVPPAAVTVAAMTAAVDRAAGWYLRNQHQDGRYMYTFYPGRDVEPPDDWCLRDLNATFVMAEIAAARGNAELRASAVRSAELYVKSVVPDGERAYVHWKEPRADSGLGSTAFLLGTLATLGRPDDAPLMRRLASAILAEQQPNGAFSTDFVARTDRDVDQQFYPGEALLALSRYHQVSDDERIPPAMHRAFEHYRGYWRRHKDGPFVPWQIRAFSALYAVRPERAYVDYAFNLMDWMLEEMPPLPLTAPLDEAGALTRMFASTGVYAEGLTAVYLLAQKVGDATREERYGNALVGCVRYILGLQFKETDVYAYPRPGKVLGALATSPKNNELRLDFTYHGISAVNELLRRLSPEAWQRLHARALAAAPSN